MLRPFTNPFNPCDTPLGQKRGIASRSRAAALERNAMEAPASRAALWRLEPPGSAFQGRSPGTSI